MVESPIFSDYLCESSPEILPQNEDTVSSPPLHSRASRRLIFTQPPLSNTTNWTPSNSSTQLRSRSEPQSQCHGSLRGGVGECMQNQLLEILSEVKKTGNKVDSYDEKFDIMEQRLKNLEQLQTASSSEASGIDTKKQKVPVHVRHLVRELYKTFIDEDENFLGFDLMKRYSDQENQTVVRKIIIEAKAQDVSIASIHIKDAIRRFFQTKLEEAAMKKNGTYSTKVSKQRKRNRITKKLVARKSALEKTTALTEDKKQKWREVLVSSFISSEESGEEEIGSDKQSVLYIKALPWRSSHVTRLFNQLDHKVDKNKTKRAKLQTLPRFPGGLSDRFRPVADFGVNFWGFAASNPQD